MNGEHACGCDHRPCGCCDGITRLTPAPICNRPGLSAIAYRVGSQARFFETMKARLSTMTVDVTSPDGQTSEAKHPLEGLTTRDPSDPSIALLDGWATVADVLTFYQERNANEGYLRTATERRSVLELARLVGYAPRPGVAASVYLAYTVDDRQVDPTTISAGSGAQSIPGPGETSQTFETSDDLEARREWNDLVVRRTMPQDITLANVLALGELHVAGPSTTLKKGDPLLFVFQADGEPSVLRRVLEVGATTPENQIEITLAPVPIAVAATAPSLARLVALIDPLVGKGQDATVRVVEEADAILRETYLEDYSDPVRWEYRINDVADGVVVIPAVQQAIDDFGAEVKAILGAIGGASDGEPTDPAQFVGDLLRPAVPQAANSLRLRRDLKGSFRAGADTSPQLLLNLAPALKDTYYTAWSNADVNPARAPLQAAYALRATASLFGATVSKQVAYYGANDAGHALGELKPQSLWTEWDLELDEDASTLYLEQPQDAILAQGYAVVQTADSSGGLTRRAYRVAQVDAMQRTAYGISGKTTRLTIAGTWWTPDASDMSTLRSTLVLAQSEPLTLAEVPITTLVGGQTIELAGLYRELRSGRWVILSGERADIPGVTGVHASELLMISGLEHGYDAELPGDMTHTTLQLATTTAYTYRRASVTIFGNVVRATNGETRREVLGSGDGAQGLQAFTLKQPPVTYVSAPTAEGAESTLHVYVDDVEWHETGSLAFLHPKDRGFVTLTDDEGNTSLIFGDGVRGARLPTGVLNANSVYRGGIGAPGNVRAEQISLLQTRPRGVNGVINPLRASGGADRESRDLARENAPTSVMPLDRLVSIEDYADFGRGFAGIAKARAQKASDGHRSLVYLTVAGVDDAPIDLTSDLYRNLSFALRRLGDPDLPLRVDLRELKILVLSARIRVLADYRWEAVVTSVRARLLGEFGFDQRALGQRALLGEAIAVIQGVHGVEYVDVDAFGAIPEKVADAPGGPRRLLTQAEIAERVGEIVDPPRAVGGVAVGSADRLPGNVDAWAGGSQDGALRPAELVILMPAVPDTIVLNQIR